MNRRGFAAVALAIAGACSSPTDSGPPPVSLIGTWDYTGQQTSPPDSIAGTFTVSSQSGHSLTGSVNLTDYQSGGGTMNLSGPVTGNVADSVSVSFDAFVGAPGTTRHHMATKKADTLSGTWLDVTSGGPGASGTFRAVLQ
ncbi:MAG TPA: hypothetical protein VFK78_05570 [Gemmatimonadales bacterium]|nr:hypothetical protein [Gemmatimonadales bacterium]